MNKILRSLAALAIVAIVAFAPALFAQEAAAVAAEGAEAVAAKAAPAGNAIYMAIAISVGLGSLGAGYAVGKVGSAVMGAAAERPEVMGKAIAFVGLGEGIALFGFLIALFLFTKL